MVIRAKFPSQCPVCSERINVGDDVEWERGKRAVHTQCAMAAVEPTASAPRPAGKVIQWGAHQEAVFHWAQHGSGSLIVLARAGSGKTTLIEEMCRRIPASFEVKYLVFNRRNAEEAAQRMPAHVDASTFHRTCWRAVMQHYGAKLEEHKLEKLLEAMWQSGRLTKCEYDDLAGPVIKLVRLAKNHGVGAIVPDSYERWHELAEHFGIDFDVDPEKWPADVDVERRAIAIARDLLQTSNKRTDIVDYDDMLYLVVRDGIGLPKFPWVCVDEAQDTNPIQLAILRRMLAPGGRLVAVGDDMQAIYGFRGASADAIDQIRAAFDAATLPLSVNYRCGKAIIAEAQTICPDIEAWDKSPEGRVVELDAWKLSDFRPTDAVLCRVTAPLIGLAYKCIGQGIACEVRGRDIGRGLISLISKLCGKRTLTLEQFEVKLDAWQQREVDRWMSRGEEGKAQSAEDKAESIRAAISALPEDASTVAELVLRLDRLFTDKGTGVLTLSTVHQSKGLEWPRVFILDRSRMPSPYARQQWQLEQELHLIYVAITRAREELMLLESEHLS